MMKSIQEIFDLAFSSKLYAVVHNNEATEHRIIITDPLEQCVGRPDQKGVVLRTTHFMCHSVEAMAQAQLITPEEGEMALWEIHKYLTVLNPQVDGSGNSLYSALIFAIDAHLKREDVVLSEVVLDRMLLNIYTEWDHRPMTGEACHNSYKEFE